jgi:integrase
MNSLTVKEYQLMFERQIALNSNGNSRGTLDRYCIALQNFLGRFGDKRHPEQFYRADVEDYKYARLKERIAPRTVNFEIAVIRAFWNWMIDHTQIPLVNIASKVKKVKEPVQARRALTEDQIDKLKAAVKDDWERLLLLLALTTGMRGNEMAALRWENIDLKQGEIVLDALETKTARGRRLPLRQDVIELLKPRQLVSGPVFKHWAAKPQALRGKFARLCKRAGMPNVGLHACRHSYATWMLRAGVDLRTVQDLLGHQDMKTTALYLAPADVATTRGFLVRLPV